ncbi:hypothetical protein AYI70_g243 [Smittium culicis]|uniref:Uncharacterized protein n=1 Tax=Smittium culicis TaxID=133412 RepID=A0A1R1YHH2_9FUNG|nr:hypothetical protein AYI70_g243 [Smittium culicis]
MKQEALDRVIVKKPSAKLQSVELFCKRQQSSIRKASSSSNTVTVSSISASIISEASSKISDRQRYFRVIGRDFGKG